MNLEELLNLISSTSVDDTKLFFITRALKPNMRRKVRAYEKYFIMSFKLITMKNSENIFMKHQ